MSNRKPKILSDKTWNVRVLYDVFEEFTLGHDFFNENIFAEEESLGNRSDLGNVTFSIFEYRFKVVISGKFTHGCETSILNNERLPDKVSRSFMNRPFEVKNENAYNGAVIDMEEQDMKLLETGVKDKFGIELYEKKCLFNGLSKTDYLYSLKDEVEALEYSGKVLCY